MAISMETIIVDGVKMEVAGTTLNITGNIISPNPGHFMEPFLADFHKKVITAGYKSIVLDVTQLTFLNSAGIRALVDWILLLEELQPEKQYSIKILYSSKHLWQESSMSTLVYLNPNLISKEKV